MMATTKKTMTKADLTAKLNQVQHQTDLLLQMNNTLVRRAEIVAGLGKQFSGDRDLYEAFGYVKNPQYEHYLNIYERDGLGTRIVDAVSDETWRERPVLVEERTSRSTSSTTRVRCRRRSRNWTTSSTCSRRSAKWTPPAGSPASD